MPAGKMPASKVASAIVRVSAALVLQTISTATRLYLNTEKNLVISCTGPDGEGDAGWEVEGEED